MPTLVRITSDLDMSSAMTAEEVLDDLRAALEFGALTAGGHQGPLDAT